jgi:pheromone shutdown protein TraB
MPDVNLPHLIDLLMNISMQLYEVYVEERNFTLAEEILRIRERMIAIIKTLDFINETQQGTEHP